MKHLAWDLAGHRIRVNVVVPGPIAEAGAPFCAVPLIMMPLGSILRMAYSPLDISLWRSRARASYS